MSVTLDYALRFHALGWSIIPIAANKQPALRWGPFQSERATAATLNTWFRDGRFGIGLVHGAVSGQSEVIDVDAPDLAAEFYSRACAVVPKIVYAPIIQTPREGGGRQIVYRHTAPAQGNRKLAERADPDDPRKRITLIETRGEGGYTVTIGSPPHCHPSGRCYTLAGGSFRTIPTLTPDERTAVLDIARSYNGVVQQQQPIPISETYDDPAGDEAPHHAHAYLPGDEFNQRADWSTILEPHGWRRVRTAAGISYWRRPGKSEGQSATTNHASNDLLYVFSSNAYPFEPERGYTKFSAFALLEHDFTEAARELSRWEFGR